MRGSGLGVARGRGATKGVVSVGGEVAERRVDGGVELAGVLWVAVACSGVWKRGASERANGLACWGFCSARARAKRGRRPLQQALHGGVAVAAAGTVLGSAGRVARPGRLQREATGGGGGAERRVGASARRINGRDGREGAPRRRRAALSVDGGENRAGVEVEEKGDFAISKNSRD